jgi:hypothetical protein
MEAIMTQTQAQLQAVRQRIATKTMKRTERAASGRRSRIHGYSRVAP